MCRKTRARGNRNWTGATGRSCKDTAADLRRSRTGFPPTRCSSRSPLGDDWFSETVGSDRVTALNVSPSIRSRVQGVPAGSQRNSLVATAVQTTSMTLSSSARIWVRCRQRPDTTPHRKARPRVAHARPFPDTTQPYSAPRQPSQPHDHDRQASKQGGHAPGRSSSVKDPLRCSSRESNLVDRPRPLPVTGALRRAGQVV